VITIHTHPLLAVPDHAQHVCSYDPQRAVKTLERRNRLSPMSRHLRPFLYKPPSSSPSFSAPQSLPRVLSLRGLVFLSGAFSPEKSSSFVRHIGTPSDASCVGAPTQPADDKAPLAYPPSLFFACLLHNEARSRSFKRFPLLNFFERRGRSYGCSVLWWVRVMEG
jgi:hypothetical protein